MVATSRKFYEPTFKARVLDEAKASGEVAVVARKHGLEPGLVYSWKANEPAVRKAARQQERQEARDAAKEEKTNPRAVKLPAAAAALVVKTPKIAPELNPDGPQLTVHALGPWLTQAVRQELPALLKPELDAVLEKRFVDIEARLGEMIRRVLKEGVG
jgi:hypothetical protein